MRLDILVINIQTFCYIYLVLLALLRGCYTPLLLVKDPSGYHLTKATYSESLGNTSSWLLILFLHTYVYFIFVPFLPWSMSLVYEIFLNCHILGGQFCYKTVIGTKVSRDWTSFFHQQVVKALDMIYLRGGHLTEEHLPQLLCSYTTAPYSKKNSDGGLAIQSSRFHSPCLVPVGTTTSSIRSIWPFTIK